MRARVWLVGVLGSFVVAAWGSAAEGGGEVWDLGVHVDEPPEPEGSGEEEDAPPEGVATALGDLELPADAGPGEVLAELRERCGPPSLAEALEAAVAGAGLEPGAEEDLVDQARWAAALPRVRVTLRRSWEYDESVDLVLDPDDGKYGVDTDDDLEVGVTAQWDLGEIVAPQEAIAARRLELEASRARQALRAEVTRIYFERCLLRLEWAAGSGDAGRRAELAWALAECEARLDALTGGLLREGETGTEREDRDPTWSNAGQSDTR